MKSLARIDEMSALAARLRGAGVRVFVTATGAGAGIQEVLWRVPGCSSFFIGAAFPYDAREIEGFLGFRPARFASEETAIDLAHASYLRALDVSHPETSAIGLGLTASVASTAAHRGDHRVHVAVTTSALTLGRTLVLAKGAGQQVRDVDGAAADELGLLALLHAAGVTGYPGLEDWTDRSRAQFFSRPYWSADGRRSLESELPKGAPIFAGTFNPPHAGHLAIASTDRGQLVPAVFAVCATPPHKEALPTGELLLRAKMLAGHDRLFTEGDPLYIDKARRFPGRTFLIGVDALVRMLDASWGHEVEPMLEEFERLGARFRVNGRVVEREYLSPSSAIEQVPARYRSLFEPVEGRWDVSSSEVREQLLSWSSR
jgi:nicotinic acid mononucleotide adenylyltransferase